MIGAKLRKRTGWRISAKLLVASMLVTILGFTAVCVSIMLDMRSSQEELARQTSENLAATIDADISRNLELYDLSLRNVAINVSSPEVSSVNPALRHLILFDHAATARHFSAIQVFDANGQLTIDASTLDPAPSSAANSEFFRVHRDNDDKGLFISSPTMHRGAYSIVLSRGITGDDGQFAGVVVGAIRTSYFQDLIGRLRLDANDVISVMRRDGTMIMRTPFDQKFIGRDFSQSPLFKRAMAEQSGAMSFTPSTDSIPRLYVWRDSSKPLLVLVGKPWTGIYALWQKQALRIGGVITLLIAFAAAIALFLAREINRRARAEESLEELATTDALTGLRNRRKFDHALEQEWRRAERSQMPLTLLMIDADHFKSYNDRFGHQAGDQALAAISNCIAIAARRAGDCAARYGGEEFALLLPGLSATAGMHVAEAIRNDIASLNTESVPLTASIGVATLIPSGNFRPVDLLEAADKALYVAKANGRNQSRLAPSAQIALVA